MSVEKEYYKQIETSMTDFEAFYLRMAEILPDDCKIAEVGCANGRSALFLADALHTLGKKFQMHMIDNMSYGAGDQRNTLINHIIKSGFNDCITLLDIGSLDASCTFPDGYFHFVFIDASHRYEQTKADIRLWYRKIIEGHILAGHDFFSPENPEVRAAVEDVVPVVMIKLNEKQPTTILNVEQTEAGHGVWWLKKDWQVNLK